ncbi:FtsX-like permease family protein [Oceanobacillus luteolus]|uniref:FtsX-like permease family protein n=1 Tax=Oceanobacillus luteolus TaxID=1274358 RepID=UPI00203E76AB|nr:FtsX-like permease family protein [Oceanobacillus luteolus]MCM3741897.1 FtsX-like permease family protein [Oceanobacillus luteolus]
MLSSWRVSWRNLTRHKKRFLFTLIALTLGVTVMTSMLIAKYTFSNMMDEQEQLYAGEADFWIQSNEGFFDETEIAWLEGREEIDEGVTALVKQGLVELETDVPAQRTVRFTGLSDFRSNIVPLPVKAGDTTEEGLVITENAAELWGKEVGDTVTFEDIGTLEVTAIVYEGPMLNSPQTFDAAFYQDFRVMVPLETLQLESGLENQISNFRFSVEEGADHQELLTAYENEFEGTSLFVQPIVVDNQQNNDIDSIYYVFDLIAILAVFISAFIAFNMIHTSIVERKREIGIMKSLGYTDGNVIRLLAQEISILAILGTVFGVSLGAWLGNAIQEVLITAIATQNIEYDVVFFSPIITSIIIGFLFPFVAASLPVYKAGKVPILEAMFEKDPSIRIDRLSKIRIVLGIVFTGIGLIDNVWAFLSLFIGLVLLFPLWMRLLQLIIGPLLSLLFGFSGKQAANSIKQFLRRNANTAAMLAIGVSLALFMSAALQDLPKGMEDEVQQTFGGDIHVEKETPWSEEELHALEEIPGVETVYSAYEIPNVTWYTSNDELREFSIMSYSETTLQQFSIEEETTDSSELPEIYLGNRALAEAGVEVGDVWTLQTPAGAQDVFIKGRVLTSHYSNYVAFAEESTIKDRLNWPFSYKVMMDVASEGDVPTILAVVWEQFGASISGVNTLPLTIEKTTGGVKGIDDLFQFLLLLIIGIAAVGISNTLFMNTMERVKEIGTIRALGFTKGQVRFMIIAEGLFIGIAGVVVGTAYGILVIYLNSISADAQGLLDFAIPWVSLILAIAGGILFTLLASWLPSYTASRISVKEAIQYE